MRDDDDREIALQLRNQLLDLGGRDRIESRGRLVEKQHGRFDRDGASDAETLLLAAGKAKSALVQLFLHFAPERRFRQCRFDADVHFRLGKLLIEPDAESDVFIDRHGERRGLLEHHADLGAQIVQIDILGENVAAVQQNLARNRLARIEIVHPVESAQQRGLTATRRADEGGDRILADIHIHALQNAMAVLIGEIEVLHLKFRERTDIRLGNGVLPRLCVDALEIAVAHVHGLIPIVRAAASLAAPTQDTGKDVEDEDGNGDDQRAGPGQLFEILARIGGECVDGHRQRGDRTGQARIHEFAIAGREEKRRCFAADTGDSQQDAGEDARPGGTVDHHHHGLPARRTERGGRLAKRIWHQQQHVLGRAVDDREGDQRQREDAGDGGVAVHGNDHGAVDEYADDDRGCGQQDVVDELGKLGELRAVGIFHQIGAGENADRRGDQDGAARDQHGTVDCVDQSTTRTLGRDRHGEDVEAERRYTTINQAHKDHAEKEYAEDSREKAQGHHHPVLPIAPRDEVLTNCIFHRFAPQSESPRPIIHLASASTQKERTNRSRPSAIRLDNCRPSASPKLLAIWAEMVVDGEMIDDCRRLTEPTTKVTAMVSPSARPRPSMMPPTRPRRV
ncbi:hypothetical protein RHSP_17315 [Rhizobium freirei PRF 81]|uniref:Uncharacterized protein n=1 Tax=Rhizobium freirei PRF 81 TaxID=363754 RepID=N6V4C3_9HYPH|nr:hypothetical protein RHSP_17315 [Rhizobium freirei PRF 81]